MKVILYRSWLWMLMVGFLCLPTLHKAYGQSNTNPVLDSLLLDAYNTYRLKQFKKADSIASEAIELAIVEGDSAKLLQARFYQTIILQSSHPESSDINKINEFIQSFHKSGNKLEMARAYQFLGKIYSRFGNVTEELKNSLEALKLFEELNYTAGVASMRSNISLLYYDQHNYEEAFKNIRICIEIEKEWADAFQLHGSYNNLAIIFEKTGPLDSAIYYHKLALEQARKANSTQAIGLSLSNLGNNYAMNNQFKLAEATLNEALAIRSQYGSSKGLAYTHNRLANLYLKKLDISKAKYHADLSLENALKSKELKVIRMAYEREMEIAQKQGDAKSELAYLKKVVALKDSIVSESNTRELTQRMLTYEFEKEMLLDSIANARDKFERELIYTQNLKTERTRKTAYLVTGLFLLLLAFSLYRRYQSRGKALEQAEQVKEAYSQLQLAHEELKNAQVRLIHSEKMASLGELTAGIAHEIQNPLNFVNNFSELNNELMDEMDEELVKGDINEAREIGKDIKQNLGKINHHGKRAESIVKGMLLHSRGSSGQKESTDINALCDEYLRLSYHGFRAKDKSFNAEFKFEADESLPKIEVVPQDIGRVLLNLINNAFYACSERSRSTVNEKVRQTENSYNPLVVVKTKQMEDNILVSVADNGNGIPQNIKNKIFQPFFTTKPTGQGTGLGLSMSYDIVKAHGGELKVETKEGEGTEFILTLDIKES